MATSHSMTNNLPQLTHPDGSPIRALVVDDEPSLSELMSMGLRMAGWSVAVAEDGPGAVRLAKEFRPDVLVLDVMLPGFDGVELLNRIRAFAPEVPALFLTAKDAVQDRITGLAAGGDDYVTKPFSIRELLARVKAFLRRQGPETPNYEFGKCRLDLAAHKLFKSGAEVDLTAKEFKLLEFFVKRAGRALTRDSILDGVWGDEVIVTGRSVDRCVTTLRGKIEPDPHNPTFIQTIRDIGYRFEFSS